MTHPHSPGRLAVDPLWAVLVCSDRGCHQGAEPTLNALAGLTRRSRRAVLVRTGCPATRGGCPRGAAGTSTVLLQRCTDEMRPWGPARVVREEGPGCFRAVEHWLDQVDDRRAGPTTP